MPNHRRRHRKSSSRSGTRTPDQCWVWRESWLQRLIAAIVAVMGTLASSWQQERSGQQEYQSDLVLRALEPDDVEQREEQLRFLLDTGLLTDEEVREGLTAYLNGSTDLPQFDARALNLLEARQTAYEAAQQVQAAAATAAAALGTLRCHPSYEPCVPNASDVDCLGGSADGPAYTGRVTVVGPDDFNLDPDGDGIGCE
jgi:hypothetical protein